MLGFRSNKTVKSENTHEKMRPETFLLNLSSGLASQGFELIDFKHETNSVTAVLQDVTTLNPDERRFHTIQFVSYIWVHTQANQIIIEYQEFDGTPNFRVRADGELCRQIYDGKVEPSTLAKQSLFTDLKSKLIIPPIPMGE